MPFPCVPDPGLGLRWRRRWWQLDTPTPAASGGAHGAELSDAARPGHRSRHHGTHSDGHGERHHVLVTPALPAGLTLNTTSGQISGTPTAATASTNYQVTASNAGGSSSYTFAMAVYFRLQVAYQSNYTFVTGVPVQNATPTVSNGTVSSWSITPALPAGLDFSTTTGTISGTPTAVSLGSQLFRHGARCRRRRARRFPNSGRGRLRQRCAGPGRSRSRQRNPGSRNRGRAAAEPRPRQQGGALESADWRQPALHLLRLPRGHRPAPDCSADSDMAGPVLAVRVRAGWDIFATADGAYVTRIADETGFDWRWSLSTDGSYLLARGASGLKAYSTANGTTLLTRAGDYPIAAIFADAGEIRAGNAPPEPRHWSASRCPAAC